jgi:hypothetical protein
MNKIVEAQPAQPSPLTRWVMHDNNTFTKLDSNNKIAFIKAMECFDADGGCIMLCGTYAESQVDRKRPPVLNSGGRKTRDEFQLAARAWLAAQPSQQEPTP